MSKKKISIVPNNSFTEFLLYTTPNGKVKVEIFLRNENIWLTQAKIADLFGVERSVVTKHLQNIFQEGELDKNLTCAKIAQVQAEGKRQVARNVYGDVPQGDRLSDMFSIFNVMRLQRAYDPIVDKALRIA
ncbi:MAG: hypothetical protein KKC39_06765 [Candidatus Omnitrophica bacterium]|nr:hypothetical protein [Candidatus Omnitrophota bacterium]MBU4303562.1 hypothetical protein [Candidatus Omnitrophota bacterium]MBU4468421.1 hypothetical protein [Candidatus Omnitrophota bacterium]MCG2708414.1 hypothetical protein [Candidatus Omnitrophota bacterium]